MRYPWEPSVTFGRTGVVTPYPADYAAFYVSLTGRYADPPWITSLEWNKITNAPAFEPSLGNPTTDGYILASTALGVRYWIAPPTGGSGVGVVGEVPTGAIDGTNTTFTISKPFVAASLAVYLNGLRQRPTTDFTIADATHFVLTSAPITGDSLLTDYQPS
jgi:hypothetical protein